MVVVVMVGILATLATFGVRKYILSAKTGEAVSMMASIKSAEEAFKDETFVYLDVSEDFGPTKFYPSDKPGKFKTQWGGTNDLAKRWSMLGVHPDAPVMFAYAVVAGGPNDGYPDPLPTTKALAAFTLPSTKGQWYIVVAKADLNGDATSADDKAHHSFVLSHSMTNEIYIENDGE